MRAEKEEKEKENEKAREREGEKERYIAERQLVIAIPGLIQRRRGDYIGSRGTEGQST